MNLVLSVTCIGILLLFCFGALPYVDFAKNAASDPDLMFVDGVVGFMKAFPLAAWFFVGVEALSLASDQVEQPKSAIPFGQVACVLTLLATGLAVLLLSVSLPPGVKALMNELVPFNN